MSQLQNWNDTECGGRGAHDGQRKDDGARIDPTPDLYTLTRRGKTTRWAGTVVQEHVECADKEAQKLLNVWVKNGVLKEVDVTTSTSKGKSRKGLRVNMSKLPGSVVSE